MQRSYGLQLAGKSILGQHAVLSLKTFQVMCTATYTASAKAGLLIWAVPVKVLPVQVNVVAHMAFAWQVRFAALPCSSCHQSFGTYAQVHLTLVSTVN